jgi:sugar lactone lactonase YvrE
VAGSIYTIAGGGTSTTSGVSALNLQLYTPQTVGVDPSGNIYVGSHVTTRRIYRIDAQTGIATAFAGNGTTATTVGGYCSGSTGPTATDTVGDGCPATQAAFQPESRISFAPKGVAYIADVANGLIRAFTFNQLFPATAVGSTATLPIAVTSPSSFVAPSISATVQGTSTGEFAGSSTDCTAGTSYAANAVCTYNLTFTPTLPGRRAGEYVLTQSGTTVATQGLEGDGLAALLAVGSGTATKIGASIANVQSITTDMLGNLYVSDASTGTLWKMAGASGSPAAILTGLNQPAQAAIDGQGNIYVADTGNNQIVELTASGTQVSLLTGLKGPNGVAVTGNGTLYVADTGNNRILSYVQGVLSQLPITGLSAPSALALDASDDLFIADTGNQRVVEYAAGTQSTVSFGSAEVEPAGVAVDPAGDVYIADKLTSSVLRMVSGASTGAALAAGLTSPSGIGIDGYGDIFYADSSVAGLNEVVQQQGSISFANTNYGESSAAETATVANIGNASLSFTSSPGYTATGDTTDFSLSTGTGGCGTASLALAATCTLEATFTPGTMNTYTEAVSFQTSAVNTATAALNLSGQGINLISTTTSIAYSPSSPVYGNTVTLTITITPTTMNGAPTGSIAVTVDGVAYQTINVAGTTAQITISSIGGTHVITATYSGDTVYASSYGSTSFTVSLQPTTTVLTYATNLAATSATLTLTAQITPGISGQPTGTVSFYSGSTLVGTVAVSAQETAVYSTTTTSYSSYTFTAVYSGDSNYATSSSGNLTLSSDFGVQQSGTTINAVAGYPVDTTVTLTSYFNYTGNLTFSCSGLPANTICRFQPTSVSLTPGASTSLTMEVFTNVSSGVQTSGIIVDKRNAWLVLLVLLASLGMVRRIARVQKSLSRCLLPVLLIASALACTLTGCSSSTQFNATTTPAGTSTVVLTVADGAGHSHTATYTLTITQQQ